MTSEEDKRNANGAYSEPGEIDNRVRYIQRRVVEISSQLDDHYHLLREIWETATSPENGSDWYDPYEPSYEVD